MRIFLATFFFLIFNVLSAQSEHIANSYYNSGKYENARLAYEEVLKRNPTSTRAIVGLTKTYRQLEKFSEAEVLLKKSITRRPDQLMLLLELGVTYKFNEKKDLAKQSFEQVIKKLEENPSSSSYIGQLFKEYNLLDYAIRCFKKAMDYNSNYNYNLEIGRMYGEQGELEEMFSSYLNYMLDKPSYISAIKRQIDDFITEDSENEANQILRKTLLKKNQAKPDILYNEMLSWLFVQQKQYRKSFLQERAIYRQTDDGILQLLDLGAIARDGKDYETAIEVYEFVIENSALQSYKIAGQRALLAIEIDQASKKQYEAISAKYVKILEENEINQRTLPIYIDYARFLAFKQEKVDKAIDFLKPLSKESFGNVDKATILLLIGDILVLNSKFSQALIYYTKAEKKVKNHPLAQEARFKIAKTSYYKGDFNWANTQLNVLKTSTTQLIANDAMDLSLLIYDNTKEETDSSDFALRRFAKAELFEFQEKDDKAIQEYSDIIKLYQGYSIEDDALFKQAILYLKQNKTEQAVTNFDKIIQFFPQSLLVDDTLFKLGKVYEQLENIDKAKEAYEKIIFNHADSIHFVEARKSYRRLRGDEVVN